MLQQYPEQPVCRENVSSTREVISQSLLNVSMPFVITPFPVPLEGTHFGAIRAAVPLLHPPSTDFPLARGGVQGTGMRLGGIDPGGDLEELGWGMQVPWLWEQGIVREVTLIPAACSMSGDNSAISGSDALHAPAAGRQCQRRGGSSAQP